MSRTRQNALFTALFDDASLFPPAELPVPKAVAGHLRHQGSWYADMCGPLICPDTGLGRLRAALTAANVAGIDLSLVVTRGAGAMAEAADAVAADPRLRLRAVEAPARRDADAAADPAASLAEAVRDVLGAFDRAVPAGAVGYVEIPVAAVTDDLLSLIAEHARRPKLRTGGVTAAAFPAEDSLAAAVLAIADWRLPFKCTAGLHHAIRCTAADSGLEQHGFLNVLLAVAAAAAGAGQAEVAAILATREAARVTAEVRQLDDGGAARSLFSSFGTCSTDEPVADLVALGLADEGS